MIGWFLDFFWKPPRPAYILLGRGYEIHPSSVVIMMNFPAFEWGFFCASGPNSFSIAALVSIS